MKACKPVGAALLLASLALAGTAAALDVPLTVRETAGVARAGEIVTSGIPLPKGEVLSGSDVAIEGVDAQFLPLATWRDGSVKWLQVSFPATVSAWGTSVYRLVDGTGSPPPAGLSVVEAGGAVTVDTGPLRFTVRGDSFTLFDEVWLDTNGDRVFEASEKMIASDVLNGSIVEGTGGQAYLSSVSALEVLEVEESGPIRAVIHFRGIHDGMAGEHLEFSGRIHAWRGRSDVRVQFSQTNGQATATYSNGSQPKCRWLAGQGPVGGAENSLLFEDLSLVTRVNLAGAPRYAIQGVRGESVATGDLTAQAWLYQDSSGGPYWYVTEGTSFRGYQAGHASWVVLAGDRADGFVDINDGARGLAVSIRDFWENFPDRISVAVDGTVSVGFMPRDFATAFEHRPGERKTHWALFHFHTGDEVAGDVSRVSAAFQDPLRAVPAAQWTGDTHALNDLVPWDAAAFSDYEQHNALGAQGFLDIREDADVYGWQDFGDLWSDFEGGGDPPNTNNAANNLEYDTGFVFIQQALRTAGLDDDLSGKWWKLAREGNEHQADIDVYHVEEGPLPWLWNGMWNHTGHGNSGIDDPHRGDSPNMAHTWNRGMLVWYYLSGDRNVLEAAMEVAGSVAWRVENGPGMPGISGTTGEERGPGHALQVMLDAYFHTWDTRYLDAARKIVTESHADTKEFVQNHWSGTWRCKPWMIAILMRNLGRFADEIESELGVVETEAVASLLAYADFMEDRAWVDRAGSEPGYFHYQTEGDGTNVPGGNNVNMWTVRGSDAMIAAFRRATDPAPRARYYDIGRIAFEDGSSYPWCHSCPRLEYMQVKVHQVLAGSGHEWMAEATSGGGVDTVPPGAVEDLAVLTGAGEGEVALWWTAPGDDGMSGRATAYLMRRSSTPIQTEADWDASLPVGNLPQPGVAGQVDLVVAGGLPPGETLAFAVRAVDDFGNIGGLSNSPTATAGGGATGALAVEDILWTQGPSSASVDFTTTSAAYGVLRWGERSIDERVCALASSDSPGVAFQAALADLVQDATYVWQIWVSDAEGNLASVSGSFTFTGGIFPETGSAPTEH
ncbi:MAG: hypothetical protein QGI43_01245 [Gemmatimonadota bacterium]|jgi:hypothetical protein|nr:hypothetical protein [Gemmatimonadota bacterium]